MPQFRNASPTAADAGMTMTMTSRADDRIRWRSPMCVSLGLLLSVSVSARAQAQRPLVDLALEDLMKVDVESVFGASKSLQKVTDAPAAVSVVTAHDIEAYG